MVEQEGVSVVGLVHNVYSCDDAASALLVDDDEGLACDFADPLEELAAICDVLPPALLFLAESLTMKTAPKNTYKYFIYHIYSQNKGKLR